mmetsp:Transcript_19194/g.25291  ORF Transcript_19194/g.25291 Transcript_19194/m.25291 type:complete len:292 (+) Transcript_19194:23-898(+)
METYFLKITRIHLDGRGNQRGQTKRDKLGPYNDKEKLKAAIMESIDDEEFEINHSGMYRRVSGHKSELDNNKIEQILANGGGQLLQIGTMIYDEDYSTYNRQGHEFKGDFYVTIDLMIESPATVESANKKRKTGSMKSVYILSSGFIPDSRDKASTSDAEEEVFSDLESCLAELKRNIFEREFEYYEEYDEDDSETNEELEGEIRVLKDNKGGQIIHEREYEGEVHHHKGRTMYGTGHGKYYYEIKQDVREENFPRAESQKPDLSEKSERKDCNEEYESEEDSNEEYESEF